MGKSVDDVVAVIKSGWMTKRSQLRSIFSFTNYRDRWFELTGDALVYYDGDPHSPARKEKGKVVLRDVTLVEKLSLKERKAGNGFQIGFRNPSESPESLRVVLVAGSEEDRVEWMSLIRMAVMNNPYLCDKFHPGMWSGGRWSCCGELSKRVGCKDITWTPRRSSEDDPVITVSADQGDVAEPQLPFDVPVATAGQQPRLVVAVYPFVAIEEGDLSLAKGQQYAVVDDSQDHWWEVRDETAGRVGFVPSNYVKELDELGLQNFDWYVADVSRQRAESMLKNEDKEGCYVVRNSSTPGLYTLSLYTKMPRAQVKHYHIKRNGEAFFLSEKHCCPSIPSLVEYHSYNAGGLACRLKCPPGRSTPPTAGLSHGKWEVDPTELTLMEELGSGQFGVVRRAKWKGTTDVAVKMMKEGTMSEDDFIEEAKLMTRLRHANLVQLYGVCSKNRPIFIITEYMKHGSLLHFLRRHKATLLGDVSCLIDISLQVCRGMAYLERHNCIHRDLAARNCLVGSENAVKVADFGLARYVIDDQYTSNGGAKFPIKWSPPEVLNYTRFSSKSDVWAFGVLCWEIMTCGEMPYGRAKNPEVVDRVQRGQILSQPSSCPDEIYAVMGQSWALNPDDRPAFRIIKEQLVEISQSLEEMAP